METNPYQSPEESAPTIVPRPPAAASSPEPPGLGCLVMLLLPPASMALASSILFGVISGPMGFVAGPMLMIFGWFYFPVVFVLHCFAWAAWSAWRELDLGRVTFSCVGALAGAGLFSMIGIGEIGSESLYTAAYAIAAGVAGFVSCMVIATLRSPKRPK